MLSAPGLRFHRALAPFHQLDVGPAHPAVGGVLGCTPFLVVFWCFIFIFYVSLCLFVFRVSLHSLGPPGGFYAWVTRDVTSDLVPFGVPLLALPGLCLLHGL